MSERAHRALKRDLLRMPVQVTLPTRDKSSVSVQKLQPYEQSRQHHYAKRDELVRLNVDLNDSTFRKVGINEFKSDYTKAERAVYTKLATCLPAATMEELDKVWVNQMWCDHCKLYIDEERIRWQGQSWHWACLKEWQEDVAQGNDSESD